MRPDAGHDSAAPVKALPAIPVYTAGHSPPMNASTPLARQNSGELLRAIIDNLAEGVLIYDSGCKVITANPAAEAILGRTLADLVGTRPSERECAASPVDPTTWPVERHPPIETLATGQPFRDVVKGVMRPDGTRVWLSVSTTLVDLPPPYGGQGVVGSF